MNTEQGEKAGSGVLHRLGDFGATVGRGTPRKRTTRLVIQIGIPALVFAALGYVVLKQWESLPSYDWHFSPGWLLLSSVAMLGFYVFTAVLWLAIVRLLGERLDFVSSQAIYAKSLLARYVPGNMLLIITRVVLAERKGVSRKVALTSVVYELAVQICAAVAVSSYFIITLPRLQGSPIRWLVLAEVPLTLLFLHPRVFRPIADWLLHKIGREPLPTVLKFRSVILVFAGYLALWSIMGIATYSFIRSVYPLPVSDVALVASAYTLSFVFAIVTFISPSGLGTRDAAYVVALRTWIPGAVAAAVAIGTRIFQTAVELIYVSVVIAAGRRRR